MFNHASYDLIYRDPRLWEWALAQSNLKGETAWGGSTTENNIAAIAEPEPFMSETKACQEPLPQSGCRSSENEEEPPVEEAMPGRRVRMPAYEGMEYQLFLPSAWKASGTDTFPVVVFLHGAGDGKFSVMNSQSLPRLLRKDQSTCFDSRTCWCLDQEYSKVTAMREAPADNSAPFLNEEEDLKSPLADCDFADTFGAIVVMPQGFLPGSFTGWTKAKLSKVQGLVRSLMRKYRGDPERVTLTGQSAGGRGAWSFAASNPKLWAAVNIICMPASSSIANQLEGLPVWVVGWTGDGRHGNDDVVSALKRRKRGSVRYTRYIKAPGPPDPLYRRMYNHASYDLIYRDPRLWQWAFSQRNEVGASEWH